jgi:hypothetical protein
MRNRRPGTLSLALALLCAVVAASGAATWASGARSAPAPWTVERAQAPGSTYNQLYGVSGVWAVGRYASAGRTRTLVLHQGDPRWTRTSSPNTTGSNELLGVSATSPTNAWAVGDHEGVAGQAVLILHYNGTKWSVQPAPDSTFTVCGVNKANCLYVLDGVTALSASNSWAVGSQTCEDLTCSVFPLIEHWNGTSWKNRTPIRGPSGFLTGVTAADSSHVWASGSTLSNEAMIERWTGSRWRVPTIPTPGSASELDAISAISTSDVWAVGDYTPTNTGIAQTLVLHWNGSSWRRVPSPNTGDAFAINQLVGVKAVSARGVWAVGSYGDDGAVKRTLVEHYNGTSWTVSSSPNVGRFNNVLNAVAARSGRNAIAVGTSDRDFTPFATHPLILHCC